MALNAYIPQDTGNLKHVAEAEASPDQLSEFVEAVQESLSGKSKDGPFVVIDVDAGFSAYVDFAEEEVVTVSRVMRVGGVAVNGSGPAAAEPAPAPKRAPAKRKVGTAKKAPAAKAKAGTAKRTVKKAPAKAAAKPATRTVKRSGSGFKRNAASAE